MLATTPVANLAVAWIFFIASVASLSVCVCARPYASLRVKIAVVLPWALSVSQSPLWSALVGA